MWKRLGDVRQLCWQLLSAGTLPVNPAEHSRVGVAVLRRMVTMHQSVDGRGVPYHPIPFLKLGAVTLAYTYTHLLLWISWIRRQ